MNYKNIIGQYKDQIIKSTQEIIRIKSVEEAALPNMPFGEGPYKALEYAVNLSKDLGFESKNLEGYAGYAEFGQGEETLGILVHLDVVPEGDGWEFDPYGGEINDGKIYGRGTVDNKGPAIASLYAMKALMDSGIELNRKVRLIFGTNEETGWGCMDYYMANEKAPDMAFTPDADFPVIFAEKGIMTFNLETKLTNNGNCGIKVLDFKGGNASNMVPDYAEVKLEVKDVEKFTNIKNDKVKLEVEGNIIKIKAIGISAHGSTPEIGENAISYVVEFLNEALECNCDFSEFIKIYDERIKFKHFGEGIGCGFEDEQSGKLTFNPGVIKFNEDTITLTINVRHPISNVPSDIYSGIKENLNGTVVNLIESEKSTKPLYIPKDNFLVKKLMEVYREQTGDVTSEPIAIGGGTYARAMDNAVAFGPMFPGQPYLAHQKNEYVEIDHLIKMTEIYTAAIYELAK